MEQAASLLPDSGGGTGLEQLACRWLGGLAPTTARGYRADVSSWLRWCAASGLDRRSATARDLTAYVTLSHLATSTQMRRLAGIRGFHVWLRDKGVIAAVPELPASAAPRTRGRDDARLLGDSTRRTPPRS